MASKSNGLDATEWARAPPSGPLWQRILKTIYNHEEKSILGRTAKRWGIVFTFYLVFYAVLVMLFGLCMGGLMLSLDSTSPTYTLDRSLIGDNPGVAYRPRPWKDGIVVAIHAGNTTEAYVQQLDDYFAPYSSDSWYSSQQECVANDSYGYNDAPCFFIKLNKIINWKPGYYDDASDLPDDMPDDLIEDILLLSPAKRKQIWVSCWEENGNTTNITYPWGRGLPARFYPYRNSDGYLSPMVAVKVMAKMNMLTIIRCRAWAKNIIYNKSLKEGSGYTRIHLYIEDKVNSDTEEVTD